MALRLGSYLTERRVVEIKSSTKADVLEEMVQALGDDAALANPERFLKAVVAREKTLSTGVGDGIAIPHARIGEISEAFVVLGRAKRPVEYGATDGKPVSLVVLIGAPECKTRLYLQLLSRTLSLLVDNTLRARILKAETPRDIHQILTSSEE